MTLLNVRVVLLLIAVVAAQNLLVNHFYRASCPKPAIFASLADGRKTLGGDDAAGLGAAQRIYTSQQQRQQRPPPLQPSPTQSPGTEQSVTVSQPPASAGGAAHANQQAPQQDVPYITTRFKNGSLEWRSQVSGSADPDAALEVLSGQMFQHSDYGPISRHAPVCR